MIDRFDPGMTSARIEVLFAELRRELVPLAQRIVGSPVKADASMLRGFPVERQREFLQEVTQALEIQEDRRARIVSLTQAGTELAEKLFAAHAEDMECAAAVISEEEQVTLIHLLRKLGLGAGALLRPPS